MQAERGGSRRGRPRTLTEAQIIEAAIRVARSVRLENVSMRALSQELGVPVTTLYNYVPSKKALVRLVVNDTLRPVGVPPPEFGSWEERLKQLERDARRAMSQLPGVSLDRVGAEESARLVEGVMSILASAGFTPDESELAFVALFTFMVGQLDVDLEGSDPVVAGVPLGSPRTSLSRDEMFEFGFGALIEGLKATLRPATRRGA